MHGTHLRPFHFLRPATTALLTGLATVLLLGCQKETTEPKALELTPVQIERLIKNSSVQRKELDLWAKDIDATLRGLGVNPHKEAVCAVISVVEQESNFNPDPLVAGLSGMVKRRFAQTKDKPLLYTALQIRLKMPRGLGESFEKDLGKVKTERDLELWYADFTASSLTKPALLLMEKDIDSLIATLGSMQVSVDFAREHAAKKGIVHRNIRQDMYTRYWGLYYGTAHLLDYERPYSNWKYVFADFNAGHFASRNAAFQQMVARLSKQKLALDGDLLNYEPGADKRSQTFDALVTILAGPKSPHSLTADAIYADLRKEKEPGFVKTDTYAAVAELYSKKYGKTLTEQLPGIRLQSDKIRRQLTTAWFADRVNGRHQRCMAIKV